MNTLAPSFLIGAAPVAEWVKSLIFSALTIRSSHRCDWCRFEPFLQVTRTSITSRRSSKLGQVGPRTVELAALGRLDLKWGKCCYHSSSFIFNSIIFILAGNEEMHESLDAFEF